MCVSNQAPLATPRPSNVHALPVRHAERSPPRPSSGLPVAPRSPRLRASGTCVAG